MIFTIMLNVIFLNILQLFKLDINNHFYNLYILSFIGIIFLIFQTVYNLFQSTIKLVRNRYFDSLRKL